MDYKAAFGRVSILGAALFVIGTLGWVGSWTILDKPPWAIFVSLLALFTGMTQAPFIVAILLRTASANWGARLYRLTALIALSFLPIALVMLIIIFVARATVIPWAGEAEAHLWYHPLFFMARQILYFGLFYGLTYWLFKTSQLKGRAGAEIGNHRLLIVGLFTAVTFVLGATMFAWDMGMTFNHHYADTIYGAYYIMTSFFAGTALLVLVMRFLNKAVGTGFFTALHFRNIGSLATALTIVCFYGWWSQFFPIWYANLPEETNVIYLRVFSKWGVAYGFMMIMVSVIPFISLLFKRVRESVSGLSTVAVIILTGLWIQQYLYSAAPLIEDGLAADLSVISPTNIALTAAITGAFVLILFRNLSRHPNAFLVPQAADGSGSEADADFLFTEPKGW